MATAFPTALDTFSNPGSTDKLNSATVPHAAQHANANDAIAALEAKVGIDASADTGSLDYKVSHLDLSAAWPVGSVFLSVVSTNPGTLLGFGTWAALAAGRMLVGLDANDTDFDTAEKTGGEKTHTLTVAEMPSHTHTQDAHNHTQDAHTHIQNAHSHVQGVNSAATGGLSGYTADTSTNTRVDSGYSTAATTAVNQNATATNQAATATNQNTGGGGAHNNLPPYLVVHMWKRTA